MISNQLARWSRRKFRERPPIVTVCKVFFSTSLYEHFCGMSWEKCLVNDIKERYLCNSVFSNLSTVWCRKYAALEYFCLPKAQWWWNIKSHEFNSFFEKYKANTVGKKKIPLRWIYENWAAKIWLDFKRAMFDHYASSKTD